MQGLSCPQAHGIFPDQGPNHCLLQWQADSVPLSHQGSPLFLKIIFISASPKSVYSNLAPELIKVLFIFCDGGRLSRGRVESTVDGFYNYTSSPSLILFRDGIIID